MHGRKFYLCGRCSKPWEEVDDARNCCLPVPVEVWICSKCETDWDTEEESYLCCSNEEAAKDLDH